MGTDEAQQQGTPAEVEAAVAHMVTRHRQCGGVAHAPPAAALAPGPGHTDPGSPTTGVGDRDRREPGSPSGGVAV